MEGLAQACGHKIEQHSRIVGVGGQEVLKLCPTYLQQFAVFLSRGRRRAGRFVQDSDLAKGLAGTKAIEHHLAVLRADVGIHPARTPSRTCSGQDRLL